MSSNKAISNLHEAYVKLSGFKLRLDPIRERDWYDFQEAGFTQEDLLLVLKYIRKQLGNGKLSLNSLKLSNVLDAHGQNGTRFGRFEENLAMAQHASRGRPMMTQTVRTPEGIIERLDESVTAPPVQLDRSTAASALRGLADSIGKPKDETK